MKKIMIFGLLLMLSISIVSALNFEAELKPIKNELFPYEEYAEYELTVWNNKDRADYFGISLNHPYWYITPESGTIQGHSSRKWNLRVRPSMDTMFQIYTLTFDVRSRDEAESLRVSENVYYKTVLDPKSYLPSVGLIVNVPEKIIPGEELYVSVNVRNRNPLDIEKAILKLSSLLANAEREIELAPLEQKDLRMSLVIDPKTPPGNYLLSAKLFYNERAVSESEVLMAISQYSIIKREIISEEKLLGLKTVETIILTNEGNINRIAEIDRQAGVVKRLFSSSDVDYNIIRKNGKKHIVWSVELKPYESFEIKYTTNYFWLLVVLIVGFTVIVGYYKFRSPLVLSKECKLLQGNNDSSSYMKVVVYLKNRSSKILNDVVILDKVPAIADLLIDDSVGIIQPAKVTNDKSRGSLLRWEIDSLESYEERILTYKLKSKLGIVGKMKLPPVKAKFLTEDGIEKVYTSD